MADRPLASVVADTVECKWAVVGTTLFGWHDCHARRAHTAHVLADFARLWGRCGSRAADDARQEQSERRKLGEAGREHGQESACCCCKGM